MANVASRAKIHPTRSTFEDKCARAMESNCVHELTVLLGSLGTEKERVLEKQIIFQQVLERKSDVGPVALQCLYHLGILGPDAHRKGVETIIACGYNADTEHIYAGAINSMLRLSDINAKDLRTIAGALHSPSRDIRASALRSLDSLSGERLRELAIVNKENVASCTPFSQALDQVIADTARKVEAIEAKMAR
jgi:hypothetical protein